MILDVQNLAFSYGRHAILRDINFSVQEGELLAILGPNGVGKTTLLKCINAIHKPSEGNIYLDGKDVLAMGSGEIAKGMGYVPQKSDIVRLTVFDAVLMGRKPHIIWRVSKEDVKMVDAVLSHLDMGRLALRHLDHLSGGELQKVAVARALVQEPRLLLLDEPTSSLDLKNQMAILGMLRRVVDEHRIGAIMTMHDLNTALRFADTFVFLKDDSIHAAGCCADVTSAMVEEVYGLPVAIHHLNGRPFVEPFIIKEEACPVHSHPRR